MERMAREFPINSRVSFDLGGLRGTGIVLGLAVDHIVRLWIVLLDVPVHDANGRLNRAISIPGSLMEPTTQSGCSDLYTNPEALSCPHCLGTMKCGLNVWKTIAFVTCNDCGCCSFVPYENEE